MQSDLNLHFHLLSKLMAVNVKGSNNVIVDIPNYKNKGQNAQLLVTTPSTFLAKFRKSLSYNDVKMRGNT